MIQHCKKCKKTNPDDSDFCVYCGTMLVVPKKSKAVRRIILLVLALLVAGAIIGVEFLGIYPISDTVKDYITNVSVEKNTIEQTLSKLPPTSSATVLLSGRQEVAAFKDANQQLPAGNSIKLWIAATFLDEVKAGRQLGAAIYTLKNADLFRGTNLKAGQSYSYDEFITFMLKNNDDTAMEVLLTQLGGTDKINKYAENNGYSQTRLNNRQGNGTTSSNDAAKFLSKLLNREVIDKSSSNLMLKALDNQGFNSQALVFSNFPVSGTYNQVGLIYVTPLRAVCIAIYLSASSDPKTAKDVLDSTVQQIKDAIKR